MSLGNNFLNTFPREQPLSSDLTSGVLSLQQEAEPVSHVIVGGLLTPGGAAEARRRAKRPVAPISLLMGQKDEVDEDLYRKRKW